MKNKVVRRLVGMLITILMILAAVILVTVLSVRSTTKEANIEKAVGKLDTKQVVKIGDGQIYKNVCNVALENGITSEQVDAVFESEAAKKILTQCLSSVSKELLNGKKVYSVMGTELEKAIDDNISELAAVLATNDAEVDMAKEKIKNITPKLVEKVTDNKEIDSLSLGGTKDVTKVSKMMNLVSKYSFLLNSFTIIICIVIIAISVLLIFIISFSEKSFGLWYGLQGMITGCIFLIVYVGISYANKIVGGKVPVSKAYLVESIKAITGPVSNGFKISAYISAWICVLGFAVHFVIKRIIHK